MTTDSLILWCFFFGHVLPCFESAEKICKSFAIFSSVDVDRWSLRWFKSWILRKGWAHPTWDTIPNEPRSFPMLGGLNVQVATIFRYNNFNGTLRNPVEHNKYLKFEVKLMRDMKPSSNCIKNSNMHNLTYCIKVLVINHQTSLEYDSNWYKVQWGQSLRVMCNIITIPVMVRGNCRFVLFIPHVRLSDKPTFYHPPWRDARRRSSAWALAWDSSSKRFACLRRRLETNDIKWPKPMELDVRLKIRIRDCFKTHWWRWNIWKLDLYIFLLYLSMACVDRNGLCV